MIRRLEYRIALAVGAVALGLFTAPVGAWADSDHGHDEGEAEDGHGAMMDFGGPGSMMDVTRTIEIEAGDVFFAPSQIQAQAGETVRLVITNTGDAVHEFTLGPDSVQETHRAEMMHMAESGIFDGMFMRHDVAHHDWNAVMLNPHERRVVVWTFAEDGEFEYGCNVPGHYEAGMVGTIEVH